MAHNKKKEGNMKLVKAICDKKGRGVIGEFDRQAVRDLCSAYEKLQEENKNLKAAIEDLKAVTCDPENKGSITGSQADNDIITDAIESV